MEESLARHTGCKSFRLWKPSILIESVFSQTMMGVRTTDHPCKVDLVPMADLQRIIVSQHIPMLAQLPTVVCKDLLQGPSSIRNLM